MQLAPSYYGVPTGALIIGGVGVATLAALLLLPSAAEASTAPGTGPRPGPNPMPPTPTPGSGPIAVEVGPAVIEPPAPMTPPSSPAFRKIVGDLIPLKTGRFYRMRIDTALAGSFGELADQRAFYEGFGDKLRSINDPAQLDPSWPPDALAGGVSPFGTRWVEGYWTDLSRTYRRFGSLTNIWEY